FVWILIESGDKEKDDAAAQTLKTSISAFIPEMQKEINERLSVGDPDSDDPGDQPVDLEDIPQVKTSVIHLSRDDLSEKLFFDMLTRLDGELVNSNETIAIPIFGEGRALWPLMGKGINDELIVESMAFLCGSCSCQIKRQNPGYDLFIPVDWQRLIENRKVGQTAIPPLMGPSVWTPPSVTTAVNGATGIIPTTQIATVVDSDKSVSPISSILMFVAGFLAIILVIGTIFTLKRGNS
ncbi:MAG: hypothetical protein HRU15_03565, partial [Planctomycetes bacterium]|nr:hypothetical protein [Planctomycetota bacterium]